MIEELRALIEECDAVSRAHPQGTPDAVVTVLETRFEELQRAWLELAKTGAAIDFAALDRSRLHWLERTKEVFSTDEGRVHSGWLRYSKRLYKLEYPGDPGPPRPALRSPISEAFEWLRDLIEALRYESVAAQHADATCNCAAAAASGRHPTGKLETLGETSDGYYFGTQYRCGDCGARWVCWIMDDSVGSARWERG